LSEIDSDALIASMNTHKNQSSYERVLDYVGLMFAPELHMKRVQSLSTAVFGLVQAGNVGISAIGKALGLFMGLNPKHAMKQVDRLLSNPGIDLSKIFPALASHLIARRKNIVVALDWTDFSKDGQATLAIHIVNRTHRTSPLVWKTVRQSDLKGRQNDIEDELLVQLKDVLPKDVHVTVLADRGFVDASFFAFLRELGFDFIIRGKSNIKVSYKNKKQSAKSWLHATGRARLLQGVHITGEGYFLPSFVAVHDKKMKDPWLIFSSIETQSAPEIIKLYGRRFSIEESFRDIKDIRFGMGLSSLQISNPDRRDRFLLICALAIPLLTLLGAAGEALGMDRMLKVNTVKRRTHSLLNQGCYYFAALPRMKQDKLKQLIEKYNEILDEHRTLTAALGWL